MNPLTYAQAIQLALQYGLPLVQKIVADFEAGKANNTVTSADLAELAQLASQSSADIYKREGVALPPKT